MPAISPRRLANDGSYAIRIVTTLSAEDEQVTTLLALVTGYGTSTRKQKESASNSRTLHVSLHMTRLAECDTRMQASKQASKQASERATATCTKKRTRISAYTANVYVCLRRKSYDVLCMSSCVLLRYHVHYRFVIEIRPAQAVGTAFSLAWLEKSAFGKRATT